MNDGTILPFLSSLPLRRSDMKRPESLIDAIAMPKIRMTAIDESQQCQLELHEALNSDILTDGENHFMLMGGFVAYLVGPAKVVAIA